MMSDEFDAVETRWQEVKLAWARGETVQYRIKVITGCSPREWEDWPYKDYISKTGGVVNALAFNEIEWQVKPEKLQLRHVKYTAEDNSFCTYHTVFRFPGETEPVLALNEKYVSPWVESDE
jgi:hypothetical protein